MQHRTVHGDACICHSCARATSDVFNHPPVDGRRADIAPSGDYLAQIYSGGRSPSAPATPREARLR